VQLESSAGEGKTGADGHTGDADMGEGGDEPEAVDARSIYIGNVSWIAFDIWSMALILSDHPGGLWSNTRRDSSAFPSMWNNQPCDYTV
jgi:hypothetical protein